MKFVARFEDGERMSDLCTEFGSSRKTGYKFVNRFRQFGPVGLYNEPKVALRVPHRVADDVTELIVQARKVHPTWGPRTLRSWMLSKYPGVHLPAASTVGELLANRQPHGARFRGFVQPHGATRFSGSWSHLQGGLRWIFSLMEPLDFQGHGSISRRLAG
jgi:hypothetical protein